MNAISKISDTERYANAVAHAVLGKSTWAVWPVPRQMMTVDPTAPTLRADRK
jgi:hypothetical protein